MKKIVGLGLIIVLILCAVFVYWNLSVKSPTQSESIFPGERLAYSVRYLWVLPIARADIRVEDAVQVSGGKVLPIVAEGKLLPFWDRWVKASFTATSFFDLAKLCPRAYEERLVVRGEVKEEKRIEYDPENQMMVFEGVQRKIPAQTQDPVSLIYFLRLQEYEEGQVFSWVVNSNQSNYVLEGEVTGTDEVNSPSGPVEAWVLNFAVRREDRTVPKVFGNIWLEKGERKVPVRAVVKTQAGPVEIRLIEGTT
jgi:hypothetical protein